MATPAIEIHGLGRSFGRHKALDDVELTVEEGSVFGLLGENGAGKTTLVKHILGSLAPQQGEVRVFGRDPVALPEEVLGDIGYLAENHELPGWMNLSELLRFSAAFYPNWDHAYAADLCRQFELDPSKKLKNVSKGQRARAGLIVALAYRPRLLILDEPSSGLDPKARRDLLEAVIRSVVSEGRTVFFSSHLLEEVERVSDHVAMLDAGKLLFNAPLDDVLDGHRLLSVVFSEPQLRQPELCGAIPAGGSGREWAFLVNRKAETFQQELSALRASLVSEKRAGLEEIFLLRAGGSRR